MKLLFDHNLSPKLVNRLEDVFPNSSHVYLLGLDREDDRKVWAYAQAEGFTIVTKDSDFGDLALMLGYPPKVVWIRHGNCSIMQIESMLRSHANDIFSLASNLESGILALY